MAVNEKLLALKKIAPHNCGQTKYTISFVVHFIFAFDFSYLWNNGLTSENV